MVVISIRSSWLVRNGFISNIMTVTPRTTSTLAQLHEQHVEAAARLATVPEDERPDAMRVLSVVKRQLADAIKATLPQKLPLGGKVNHPRQHVRDKIARRFG